MSKTPKLRFKEFSGDWESKKLGELGEFKNGVNKSKEDFGHGYPFINLMDVFGKNSIKNGKFELVSATDKELTESNLVEGDVLFIRSSVKPSGVGLTAVILEDLKNTVYSGFLIRFRDSGYFDLNFKKYCFYNSKFRNELISKSSTSANTNINQENLKLLNINLPSLEEQEKIASFFSLIDDKISLQGEKVEALKDYKKGMMQKIFSRELRFKDDDGRDYPEWISCKVGDCFSERSERGFEDLELLSVSMQNGVIRRSDIEGKDNSSENKSNYKLVKVDDIVYNSMRMWQGASGLSKFEGIVSPAYTILIPKNNVCSKYFAYLFKMEKIIYEFRKYSQGLTSDTWNLKYPQIKDIKVKLPSYDEQVKISNFIENIDNKIRKEQDKLDSLNGYKKGLLQQMFI